MRFLRISLVCLLALNPAFSQNNLKALDRELENTLAAGLPMLERGGAFYDLKNKFEVEMQNHYTSLVKSLRGPARKAFVKSQEKWLAFRKAQVSAFETIVNIHDYPEHPADIRLAEVRLVQARARQLACYSHAMIDQER